MGHYHSNLRDLEFNLFEVFGSAERLGNGPFSEIDVATAKGILAEVERLASTELSESYAAGDRTPPVFDAATHTATLPEPFKKTFRALMNGEWYRLDLPTALGGSYAPPSLRWAIAELLLGSNPAAFLYMSGPAFAAALHAMGTDDQKKLAEHIVEHQWGATMMLTEPDAGSDVGGGRTKAMEQPDGTWHLEGVKRFITGGEHDLTENIVHFVLARPVGAGPGTKGLSMFVVPKYRVNTDGSLGERNGIYATNLEHKMGLRVSTTCEMTLGENDPAVGYLVGGVHDGIAQMFKIIEYARMMVGTKAIASLSSGYLNALEFAKQRVQGSDLTQRSNKSAPRVTIIHHPDIRRSLMRQKSYAEGLRALVMYTASIQDEIKLAEDSGETETAQKLSHLNDLLLPVVKGCGSERSYELLGSESLQTLGGSGFLEDYPLEQYVRDAKIDTLYEGTTAIQGQDLFFRKIFRDQGQALGFLAEQIGEFAQGKSNHIAQKSGQLKEARAALSTALSDVEAMVGHMVRWLQGSVSNSQQLYKIGLNTTRLLLSLGDVIVGWLLQRQAEIALSKIDGASAKDALFYRGKVASANFFAETVLPELSARRHTIETTTLDIMELPEASF